jgi:hypothetical protein
MAKVPITVMGFRCDRCAHEWIPRGGVDGEPMVCPKCHSPWWNRPPKGTAMTYDVFKQKIASVLRDADKPLTWTEVRTAARLPQLFPNNQWVDRLEKDIRLIRRRESDGTIHWEISKGAESATTAETTHKFHARPRGKESVVE